jgi:hypothetical protein
MTGFPGGRRKDGQHLRLELIYATAFSMAPDLVETLRRQWFETFGVELVVNPLDSSLFYTALISGDYTGMAMADSSWLAEPATNMEMFLFGDNANGTFGNLLRLRRSSPKPRRHSTGRRGFKRWRRPIAS